MKLSERLNRLRFEWAVRAIRDTPSIARGHEPYIALSMVQHRDVLPYLLALKSVARFVPPEQVVVVADPTLDDADRKIIRQHVPHIIFRDAAEFHRDGIPRGGTWERLCAIAEYARNAFVVQIDADTVAIGDLVAVRRAVYEKRSFTLGTEDVQPILTCQEASAIAQLHLDADPHVQIASEAALGRLEDSSHLRYARGCSGFAGFAPGDITPELVHEISTRMEALVGLKWRSWGSEQFASNIIVCSAPRGHLLPHPDYCAPTRLMPNTVFMHFMGFIRFRNDLYARLAGRISQELMHGAAAHRHAA